MQAEQGSSRSREVSTLQLPSLYIARALGTVRQNMANLTGKRR